MRFSQAFSPIRALGASWRMLAAAPVPMLIGGILLMLTSPGGSGGGGSDDSGGLWNELSGGEVALIIAIVFFALAFVILWWMLGCLVRVGFARAAEDVLAKGHARFGQLFEPRGLFLKLLLTTLLRALLSFATLIPLFVIGLVVALVMGVGDVSEIRGMEGVGLAVMLLIVVLYLPVLIYVSLGLALMPEATAIEGYGPMEALKRSWALASGRRLDLLVYYVVTTLFGMLGLLACCVGVFLTGAMVQIAYYESYLRYIRSEEEQAAWTISGT